jgi:hypothetical protein
VPFSVIEVKYRAAAVVFGLKFGGRPIHLVRTIDFDVVVEFLERKTNYLKIVRTIHEQSIALASDIAANETLNNAQKSNKIITYLIGSTPGA